MGRISWHGLMIMRIYLSRPIVQGWSCHLAVIHVVNEQLRPHISILRQHLRWTNVQTDRQMNIRIDERTGERTLAVKMSLSVKIIQRVPFK